MSVAVERLFFVHLSSFLWSAYTGLSVWLSDQEKILKDDFGNSI